MTAAIVAQCVSSAVDLPQRCTTILCGRRWWQHIITFILLIHETLGLSTALTICYGNDRTMAHGPLWRTAKKFKGPTACPIYISTRPTITPLCVACSAIDLFPLVQDKDSMIIAVLWPVDQARRKPGGFVGLDGKLMRRHVFSPGNTVLTQS